MQGCANGHDVWCPGRARHPGIRCREDGGAGGLARPKTRERDESGQEPQKGLLCGICSAPITTDQQRFSKNGRHLHTFFNPAGILYEIGCFRDAPGCLVHGPASREFPWFADYRWQLAFCATCSEHLGWYFSSDQDGFFGLIVNRLRG